VLICEIVIVNAQLNDLNKANLVHDGVVIPLELITHGQLSLDVARKQYALKSNE
jgi:hypothetical protein